MANIKDLNKLVPFFEPSLGQSFKPSMFDLAAGGAILKREPEFVNDSLIKKSRVDVFCERFVQTVNGNGRPFQHIAFSSIEGHAQKPSFGRDKTVDLSVIAETPEYSHFGSKCRFVVRANYSVSVQDIHKRNIHYADDMAKRCFDNIKKKAQNEIAQWNSSCIADRCRALVMEDSRYTKHIVALQPYAFQGIHEEFVAPGVGSDYKFEFQHEDGSRICIRERLFHDFLPDLCVPTMDVEQAADSIVTAMFVTALRERRQKRDDVVNETTLFRASTPCVVPGVNMYAEKPFALPPEIKFNFDVPASSFSAASAAFRAMQSSMVDAFRLSSTVTPEGVVSRIRDEFPGLEKVKLVEKKPFAVLLEIEGEADPFEVRKFAQDNAPLLVDMIVRYKREDGCYMYILPRGKHEALPDNMVTQMLTPRWASHADYVELCGLYVDPDDKENLVKIDVDDVDGYLSKKEAVEQLADMFGEPFQDAKLEDAPAETLPSYVDPKTQRPEWIQAATAKYPVGESHSIRRSLWRKK